MTESLNWKNTDTHTYNYKNIPLRYHKTGSGPALLLLHGWGSSSDVMIPLASALSDIRTCYIPDLPGFGDSPPPSEPWSVDDYVECMEHFVTAVIHDRVDILAHSFGGRMTLKWCSRVSAQNQIDKVIITGGAGMKPHRTLNFYRRKYTAMLLKAPFLILPEKWREKSLGRLRETGLWKSLGSAEYQQLEGVMRQTFVRTVTEYLEPCLPDISHEVLLLWGKEDDATPLYQGVRMEKGLRNGALVVIDRAGHYAFLDQPDRFIRIARSYLNHHETHAGS